jgi:hypothetical protein
MGNCANLPAEMKIDYMRLYQDPQAEEHTLSCSPPRFPTSDFIADFPDRYQKWDSNQKIRLDGHDKTPFFLIFLVVGLGLIGAAALIDYFIFNQYLNTIMFTSKKGINEQQRDCGSGEVTSSSSSAVIINEKSPLVQKL